MGIAWTENSAASSGGTELMGRELEARLDKRLMDEVQIFPSRVTQELDPTKVRLLWLHDMPDDPMNNHLADGGWRRFHRLVFVSNYQMQGFIQRFGIPWSKCIVRQNAIVPLEATSYDGGKVRLIYTPTPHRGLNILLGAFTHLAVEDPDVELDVYSSFKLYGWEEQDKNFQAIFDRLEAHPQINYHGSVPQDEVRAAVSSAHIFAYPSIWPETSCRCLIEAMSAGLVCVHPNLAALPETSANWTHMYQYHEDNSRHATLHYTALKHAVDQVRAGHVPLTSQKLYTDMFYSWDYRIQEWSGLIESLLGEPRAIVSGPEFVYRT